MTDIFQTYIQKISRKYANEMTSEYGYRTDFENLLETIFEEINVKEIEHDARTRAGNKPDFIILNNHIPILYIETKDIGVSLDKVEKSDQMARYYGYANLVLTDYLEFRFYRNGQRYESPIIIGKYNKNNRTITPKPDNYARLQQTLIDFTVSYKEPIKSGLHLSKIMGGKARRIKDNIFHLFTIVNSNSGDLQKVYETIKKLLVHDLEPSDFADMYAQTLVYGLFVARYHDRTPENFSRSEARELIPASNPFLRHFFDHIAGPNFNKRLEYIVDELCEVFSHADIEKLMRDYYRKDLFGYTKKGPDPVIHFYEDFLKEYDPKLRKKMGAYYTPQPIVQFIVHSVDYLLKNEFKLSSGLADTSKTDDGTHKVQVLDPAVGTGTFFSKVIGYIYKDFKKNNQLGRWNKYVDNDLLPRLHGFEIMMAPYTIAHLKLSIAFKETGFKYFNKRLGIYLTNSLEDVESQTNLFPAFGFAESIAKESEEASKIKRETPIMVILGNPPYSVSSHNKGEWIQNLIKVYKKDLNERKINLDDDYIKFIRFAEHFIEKNGSGIVAMITNNSFIDGITHRQMRKHLLETFDIIYILDLHGNAKKKEEAPDGSKDENVFNIMQGVSINIFLRKENVKKGLGQVYHADLYGRREKKFERLNEGGIGNIKWKKLSIAGPYYFFTPKDFRMMEQYEKGFGIDELIPLYNSGIQTKNDKLAITFTKKEIKENIERFQELSVEDLRKKFPERKETSGWNFKDAKEDLLKNDIIFCDILYRPFDIRHTVFTGQSGGFIGRPRNKTSKHFINRENLSLLTVRQQSTFPFQHIIVSNKIVESGVISLQTKEWGYQFPLYLYSEDGSKNPNFKPEIFSQIINKIGKITPEELFDYIYAVLHSPTYRTKYKEFLKIDFPRVPYPIDKNVFKKLVKLGSQLRELHLMESPKLEKLTTTYPIIGSDEVERVEFNGGRVYINPYQYFGKVPKVAWNLYIGGYQPARKWLKDRKGRDLSNEDIVHYQKIIIVLMETDNLMKEIDGIIKITNNSKL